MPCVNGFVPNTVGKGLAGAEPSAGAVGDPKVGELPKPVAELPVRKGELVPNPNEGALT